MTANALPFRISTLIFLQDSQDRLLLIKRLKAPNKGCWSPPGGKLDFDLGESPFECALRETQEETGISLDTDDLHLFGYISEKNFEGSGHWLMFLFRALPRFDTLPTAINEGHFAFHSREAIDTLEIPATDRRLLWPFWDSHREHFVALRADCNPKKELQLQIEQSHFLLCKNSQSREIADR